MSWDDPFKPVDWSSKSKSDSNDFYKPMDPYGSSSSPASSSWAYSTGSPSGSSSSSSSSSNQNYWSSPTEANKSSVFNPMGSENNSNWGYSSANAVNANRSWAFSSGSAPDSNSYGFGASGFSVDHHKERLFSQENKNQWNQDTVHVSDQNWHWGNINGKNERDAFMRHLDEKSSSDLFRPSAVSSNWAFSSSSSDKSAENWHWGSSAVKNEPSWAFSSPSNSSNQSLAPSWGNSSDNTNSNSVFQPTASILKRW